MKTTLLSVIVFVTLLFVLCACASLESKLIGHWEMPTGMGYFEFNSDHSYTICDNFGTQKGTWRLEDSTLLLKTTSLALTKKYYSETGLSEADMPDLENPPELPPTPEIGIEIEIDGDELTMTQEGVTKTFTKR